MKIEFHPKASEELVDSSEFYEPKVVGLGDEFINEVERTIQVLNENPKIGIELDEYFRRAALHRFPFSLIYTIEETKLWIIAVAHQRLKPGYWKARMER